MVVKVSQGHSLLGEGTEVIRSSSLLREIKGEGIFCTALISSISSLTLTPRDIPYGDNQISTSTNDEPCSRSRYYFIFRRVRGGAGVTVKDLSEMGNDESEYLPGAPFGTEWAPTAVQSPVGQLVVMALWVMPLVASKRGKLVPITAFDNSRASLIPHLSIKWERGEIVWPVRNGTLE